MARNIFINTLLLFLFLSLEAKSQSRKVVKHGLLTKKFVNDKNFYSDNDKFIGDPIQAISKEEKLKKHSHMNEENSFNSRKSNKNTQMLHKKPSENNKENQNDSDEDPIEEQESFFIINNKVFIR